MATTKEEILILIGVTILVVTALSFTVTKLLGYFINKNSKEVGADPTGYIFLKNSAKFVFVTIGLIWIFYSIPYFKSLGSTLFAGAGILAAIIGFASQKAFSNIIGGIFILIFKPFRVGQIITVANRGGVVEEITLRHVIIRDFEFRRIIIPNSAISDETIINSSIKDEKIRKHIEFGISYDSDVDLAMALLKKEAMDHPLSIDNRTAEEKEEPDSEAILTKVISLNDSSITIRAWVWAKSTAEAFELSCDLNHSVKRVFEQNGIKIPYPQVEVTMAGTKPEPNNSGPDLTSQS